MLCACITYFMFYGGNNTDAMCMHIVVGFVLEPYVKASHMRFQNKSNNNCGRFVDQYYILVSKQANYCGF